MARKPPIRLSDDERAFIVLRRLHVQVAETYRKLERLTDGYVSGLEDELMIRLHTDFSGGITVIPMHPDRTERSLLSWHSPDGAIETMRDYLHSLGRELAFRRGRVPAARSKEG